MDFDTWWDTKHEDPITRDSIGFEIAKESWEASRWYYNNLLAHVFCDGGQMQSKLTDREAYDQAVNAVNSYKLRIAEITTEREKTAANQEHTKCQTQSN